MVALPLKLASIKHRHRHLYQTIILFEGDVKHQSAQGYGFLSFEIRIKDGDDSY